MRRSGTWRLWAAGLLLAPVAELAVLIAVGTQIGVLATVGLLLAGVVAGSLVMRREGARAVRAVREAGRGGRPPGPELSDRALVFGSGFLLLAPGFLSDLAALVLWLPPVRRALRRTLAAWALRHAPAGMPGGGPDGSLGGPSRTRGPHGDDVVAGEVVREP